MAKLFSNRLADYVDQWDDDNSGRIEFVLRDGTRYQVFECYLSRDQAGRPDAVWINQDTPGLEPHDFDIDEIPAVFDRDQIFVVLSDEN
ncbi:hypothetical protein NA78x_000824 [Anatilimnocola sp. NA78]|uniref:hypothetical protein n=1 Tax=Anatilimnocola sp. NA78 TaxID=3415683 RepID=UPI003CE54829